MSEENVESVKRFLDAYNRRDVEGMLAELDPEVEWHPALPEALMGRGPAVYRGHGGVRSMFADLYGAFAELHVEVSEIRDLGDQVLAVGSFPHRRQGERSRDRVAPRGRVGYEGRQGDEGSELLGPSRSPRSRRAGRVAIWARSGSHNGEAHSFGGARY